LSIQYNCAYRPIKIYIQLLLEYIYARGYFAICKRGVNYNIIPTNINATLEYNDIALPAGNIRNTVMTITKYCVPLLYAIAKYLDVVKWLQSTITRWQLQLNHPESFNWKKKIFSIYYFVVVQHHAPMHDPPRPWQRHGILWSFLGSVSGMVQCFWTMALC